MSIAVTTTDPTNTGVSTTSSSSLTGSNAADLQSSFLTLLVAQLKNQDPTNPMENNELTSQLAQISTVSGIEKLNTTLGSISGQIDNSQSLQASNLIGHGVMIPGTTVLAGTGSEEGAVTTTTPFGVELQQAADKVTATITDMRKPGPDAEGKTADSAVQKMAMVNKDSAFVRVTQLREALNKVSGRIISLTTQIRQQEEFEKRYALELARLDIAKMRATGEVDVDPEGDEEDEEEAPHDKDSGAVS